MFGRKKKIQWRVNCWYSTPDINNDHTLILDSEDEAKKCMADLSGPSHTYRGVDQFLEINGIIRVLRIWYVKVEG